MMEAVMTLSRYLKGQGLAIEFATQLTFSQP